MEILVKALQAIWQVALVGLLLGAGLPALFALGVRALHGAEVAVGAPGSSPSATPARRTLAYLCFGVCVAAVVFGIVVIVFGQQIFGR
jgi:hypothetical protein